MADGDVDAIQLLRLIVASSLIVGLLVQDGVECHSGFAGLTVTDDQFALATANGDHGVHGLQAGCHRLVNRFARDDAGGLLVSHATLGCRDRAFAVDRVAKTVHNAAQKGVACGHVHDGLGALDGVAFFDVLVRTEDHDADVVDFEVQRHAADPAGEFHHFTGLDIVQPVHTGDAVADRQHAANFGHLCVFAKVLDLVLKDRRDLSSLNSHHPTSFIAFWRAASFDLTEVSIMVEPSLTIRPPMRLSSTVVFSFTVLPTEAFSVSASFLA